MESRKYYRVLDIAGSDSIGGAGLQADLKTFSALGCYGMFAVTALVNEDTVSVRGIHDVPADFVRGQIISALDDLGANAVKTGMLHDRDVIDIVTDTLAPYKINNLVVDPVMVNTAGQPLLEAGAVKSLRDKLIPMARIITPNLPEAEILLGRKIEGEDFENAARDLAGVFGVSVMLKAGHLESETLTDYYYNAETGNHFPLSSRKVNTRNTNGTGCTLSAAITAKLAHGLPLDEAVREAKEYVAGAIAAGALYDIGRGHGSVHHFYRYWT